MNLKYFGTDGIRGTYQKGFFTSEFVKRLGIALARFAKTKAQGTLTKIIIGRDTRASGVEIEAKLLEGLADEDIEVSLLGVLPTPAVSKLMSELEANLGIMITASHNPASDNGIKLFDAEGMKLSNADEVVIEEYTELAEKPQGALVNNILSFNGVERYMQYFKHLFSPTYLSNWTVVVDTANGATTHTTPNVLKSYGANVITIANQPNGENINQGVGSEHPGHLIEAVLEHKADFGIAHDGDGDRVIICDKEGSIIPGEVVLGLLSKYSIENDYPSSKHLVTTIQSNLGLDKAVQSAGGKVVRVDVGDRNVAIKMHELRANLGGESSGHIIFKEHAKCGDGLFAALIFIDIAKDYHKSFKQLRESITLFPQITRNLTVKEKLPLESLSNLNQSVEHWKSVFGDKGRILIRYSGTEPKIRLLVEGEQVEKIEQAMLAFIEAIHQDLVVL